MPTTFAPAPKSAAILIATVMGQHHKPLLDAKIEVRAWLVHAPAHRKTGEPTGPALRLHGWPCAATVRVNPLKRRVQGLGDAEILIDGDRWEDWSEAQQRALIDHKLEHLELRKDKKGEIRRDPAKRPILSLRLHDYHLEGFTAILDRHGPASFEAQLLAAAIDEHGQYLLPFLKPAADRPAAPAPTQRPLALAAV